MTWSDKILFSKFLSRREHKKFKAWFYDFFSQTSTENCTGIWRRSPSWTKRWVELFILMFVFYLVFSFLFVTNERIPIVASLSIKCRKEYLWNFCINKSQTFGKKRKRKYKGALSRTYIRKTIYMNSSHTTVNLCFEKTLLSGTFFDLVTYITRISFGFKFISC